MNDLKYFLDFCAAYEPSVGELYIAKRLLVDQLTAAFGKSVIDVDPIPDQISPGEVMGYLPELHRNAVLASKSCDLWFQMVEVWAVGISINVLNRHILIHQKLDRYYGSAVWSEDIIATDTIEWGEACPTVDQIVNFIL